jgi:hypothetical protein
MSALPMLSSDVICDLSRIRYTASRGDEGISPQGPLLSKDALTLPLAIDGLGAERRAQRPRTDDRYCGGSGIFMGHAILDW